MSLIEIVDTCEPGTAPAAASLTSRVRGEFIEMPGLTLTPAQAARLWAIDAVTSERILQGLKSAGFLNRNRAGAFSRASEA
jgi:hypothetical protein